MITRAPSKEENVGMRPRNRDAFDTLSIGTALKHAAPFVPGALGGLTARGPTAPRLAPSTKTRG